ncbi:MAG: carbamoyltransferase HypF [Gemmatimonadales bacterium]|nr:carbamoyltransferase HypF [Gemmatimonadales bacterium]
MAPPTSVERVRLHVTGVVQGVGFRPFIHRLAIRNGLGGWVRNASGNVEIEIEGQGQAVRQFREDLETEAPPLARIERVDVEHQPPEGQTAFHILTSRAEPNRRQPVSPDVAICAACEAELFERTNRRYRFPFITCTDCGPRFTVIDAMPYDRERTSMGAFTQCEACLAEYESPADRRYHSETNSCPECGPEVWFTAVDAPGATSRGEDAIQRAADFLTEGRTVAIRGLGGFHLAVDATDAKAVARLRRRKRRDAKPLAIMVRTLDDARRLAQIEPVEESLLVSAERPIVLLAPREHAPPQVAREVYPGLDRIGVMLAYTPLHHLLLDAVNRPLVMTSGNVSDEPIATGNAEALVRLRSLADGFLLHNREIVSRYDDSVLRTVDGFPVFLRRARGYAPLPLELPVTSPVPLVAVGPHLKNTLTLVHGNRAYVSQHIGDLENLETLEHFQATLDRLRRLFHVDPHVAVRDLHPGYLSTRVAEELDCSRTLAVQHHHAHVASVMAEHGITEPVIGVAYDGTGYGDDGKVWGAEILHADFDGYERLAHLRYAPLPGGDRAVRAPWRTALGYCSLEPTTATAFTLALRGVDPAELELANRQITRGLNSPEASSMGRLFDAAAAVLGLRRLARYEGQAAMELEALAAGRRGSGGGSELPYGIEADGEGAWVLDPVPLLVTLGERAQGGEGAVDLAADFHTTVAAATVRLVERACEQASVERVVLSGGVFQNALLLADVTRRLEALGLTILVPRALSPNDGAISYGQAAVAAAMLGREPAAS